MKIIFTAYKKDQSSWAKFDAEGNGQFIFETSVKDMPKALKLLMLKPKRAYKITVEAPEIREKDLK